MLISASSKAFLSKKRKLARVMPKLQLKRIGDVCGVNPQVLLACAGETKIDIAACSGLLVVEVPWL